MPEGSKPWYESILSPLKRAFARQEYLASRREELGGYLYDESDFFVFTDAALDPGFDAKKGRSAEGFIGSATFHYVREPFALGMPFAVDHLGARIRGSFSLNYVALQLRMTRLESNGIRPTETEKAIKKLDALLGRKREKAGLDEGRVMEFPGKAL